MFHTVMSYTASPSSVKGDNKASFYPTTPMYFDLLAIQNIYGDNFAHNSGNTTYTYNDGQTYFETIDDAGGIDTIVFNGTQDCTIDLMRGQFCKVSEEIQFTNGGFRATVCIGPYSFLERAIGGNGNDVIRGNEGKNILWGRGGADNLNGGTDDDRLSGGLGRDVLVGGAGKDTFSFVAAVESGAAANLRDVIWDFVRLQDRIDVSLMDASTLLTGNNVFVWRGAGAITTSGAGEVRYQRIDAAGTANDMTIVFGDTDADTAAEFQI